jgi:hypothetical protein
LADAPESVLALADAREAVIGLERVATGGDEIDDGVESPRASSAAYGRPGSLRRKFVAQERLAAGAAEHVLGEHVERADAQWRRVLRFSAMASSAARHSSTSKRFAGTSTPFDGSSMR